MNFSINSKAKRILSLMCVLILMAAMFAGCKKNDGPAPETTEPKLDLNLDMTPTEAEPVETEPTVPETTAPVVSEKSATVISQLKIRSAPTLENDDRTVIGTLNAGDKVIVERREEVTSIVWAYISSPQTGWICMDFVEMDIPDAKNDNTSTPAATDPGNQNNNTNTGNGTGNTTSTKGVITATGGLMIRSEASTKGEVLGTYNKGDVVTILETKNGWGRTNKGWIKLEYVNTTGNTTGSNNNTNTNTNTNTGTNISGNGSTSVILKGVVKANDLNIRASASKDSERLGSYTYGNRVEFYERSGNWGRTNKGWISLDYVYQDGTTGTKTATGTITGSGLNIRSGPGTGYDVVGSLSKGDTVSILEQFTYGNTTWGCIRNGWISMDYVDVGGNSNTNNNTSTGSTNTSGMVGVITGDGVRIRSGAGTTYDVIGSYNSGQTVTILEQKTVNDTVWGKTNLGWVSLTYVRFD